MRPELTFCITSCGEQSEAECRAAVALFGDRIVLQEVLNVTPQVKALNQMLSQAETTYLVPLDADIVLYWNAYDRIHQAIAEHENDPSWYALLFPLYDTLTDKRILALKVLRTALVKNHLFSDSPTPDVEHFDRLKQAGYGCITKYLSEPPIGRHVVAGHKFCYFKYRDVYFTLRTYGKEWDPGVFMGGSTLEEMSKRHFDYFLYRWATTQNDDYLYCIAGIAEGVTMFPNFSSKNLDDNMAVPVEMGINTYWEWYINRQPKNNDMSSMIF